MYLHIISPYFYLAKVSARVSWFHHVAQMCAHLSPFSLTLPVLDWRLATQGFIFCQHVQANTRRPLLIGTDSLSGKIQPSPSEPLAPRWVEISCRLLQEVKKQGGGKEEQKKEDHTLLRLITGASAEQWPLCVHAAYHLR